MIKLHYIILFLICFFVANSDKNSSKNLRNLDLPTVSFSKGENLKYESNAITFDIVLSTDATISEGNYKLTILFKREKVYSTCTFSNEDKKKLSCSYSCDIPYYGSIKLPAKSQVLEDDTISLNLITQREVKPTQSFLLKYSNAVMAFNDDESYDIQVYLDPESEIPLLDNTYVDLDLDISTGNSVAGCTYSSSSKMLNCKLTGGSNSHKVSFIQNKISGSINWDNSEFPPETIIMKIVADTNIYGYYLDFVENQWQFKIYLHSSDITFNGYYCTINVILKKIDGSEVNANAKCQRTYAKELDCVLTEGTQAKNDLVYINPDQAGATVSFKNNFLTQKKLMIRLIELKYEKAYDLKFENSKWTFKIKVTAEEEASNIVRDGLNVTVALFSASNDYHQASCTYISSDTILSCVREKTAQYADDSFTLVPQKSVGSVTWSNLKEVTVNIKIILEIKLTHSLSYYLAYNDLKWTFKTTAKCMETMIPKDSLIIIDLVYGNDQYTIAKCDGNPSANAKVETTFTCNCDSLDSSTAFQISNIKKDGSVTWNSQNSPITIDKRNEFKFIDAYNMYLNYISTADHKWYFEIEFEDVENIKPTTSDIYSIDILYTTSATSSRSKSTATCSIKSGTTNVFSCVNDGFTNNVVKDATLYISKSTTKTSKFIQWTGIEDYYPIVFNAEFYLVKGTLSCDNKCYLNILVENPKDGVLPIYSKVILDITQDSTAKTIVCFVKSKLSLNCETDITSYSLNTLPVFAVKKEKSASASARILNTQSDGDSFYYLYLEAQLTFSSAQNLIFNTNIWQFDLSITEALKENTRFIIDVLYNNEPSTARCIKGAEKISCTVDKVEQSDSHLVTISPTKTSSSTITWKNVSVKKDIIMNKDGINVDSVKSLLYEDNKWEFKMNLVNSDLPVNSVVKIDIVYQSSPSTATCTTIAQDVLSCVPDIATQQSTDSFTLSSEKNQGSISYAAGIDNDKLTIQTSTTLTFDKVLELTLTGSIWQFKIQLIRSNLENTNPIQIDIEFNGVKSTATCVPNDAKIELTCTKEKTKSDDKIVLINNPQNLDLVWINLKSEVVLYVSYNINYVNCYGGFHDNKWKFILKYQHNDHTIDANGNYALIDITVNSALKTAKCQITEKYLLCESQDEEQTKHQTIKLYGEKTSGSVSVTNLPDTIDSIKPINLNLQQVSISDFDNSNEEILFNIKGKLKDNEETEIAENTITEIYLKITKKTETNDNLETVCLTNEIKSDNDDVVLSCRISENMNKDEDDVDIKVDSNGNSYYVTFASTTQNIKVFNHKGNADEQNTNPEETGNNPQQDNGTNTKDNNNKGNNGNLMKLNYIVLIGIFLLL